MLTPAAVCRKALDESYGAQPLPLATRGDPADLLRDPVAADFQPPVALVGFLKEGVRRARKAARLGVEQKVADFLMQKRGVGLEGQHVVGVRLLDLAGNVLLRVERIGRDDAARQFELAQEQG
jgi:predicted component of type VI protein secretion system